MLSENWCYVIYSLYNKEEQIPIFKQLISKLPSEPSVPDPVLSNSKDFPCRQS